MKLEASFVHAPSAVQDSPGIGVGEMVVSSEIVTLVYSKKNSEMPMPMV